ncbi:isoleucine--tRNA ligase [Candidatus Methylomirabilis sp.]|uniref:isoleucine--tRNA ligase n=1 Tax=Candidatus Methylomirabilis sp. TaxID=2032687 RepID=UPI002A6024BD|nr:isoleucine--tRNA ligase [Candidatus Methylomirabilis sp.]
MNYKETLNLPTTTFPMKADLPVLEPSILKRWEDVDLYGRLREVRADRQVWILHDGPPYANGHIHIGHALNKILKDIVVKSKSMFGYNTAYVPGWDCHGLPIEHQVDKNLGGKKAEVSLVEKRRLCREYAARFIDIQREEFRRLGVLGNWSDPYLTMDYKYEATIVRELGRLFATGAAYKGKKPVHWCASCRTALAEAEVEYGDHTSASIYVKFPLNPDAAERLPVLQGTPSFVVIWTTTPWTLPANLAIAVHPDAPYVIVEASGELFIVAKERLEETLAATRVKESRIVKELPGRALEGLTARHPWIERSSQVVLADYVTMDQGTGCVHTAPGHGVEDYETGLRYGLEIYNPVDAAGRFVADLPLVGGLNIWEANSTIIAELKRQGLLLSEARIEHSYPHCWRCKNPTIFRATEQWFISMDAAVLSDEGGGQTGLRAKALAEIKQVRWIPSWGEDRISNMVAYRSDWCISRQRAWGVPIVAFYCAHCGHILADQRLAEHVATMIERAGADLWYTQTAADLLPPGTACPNCERTDFEKERDILDVWFDSGVSHAAVLETRPDQRWPADMYLEGSDQHRGWFHSALLTAVGTRGRAPYRAVLTHGFVVDGEGKKMSKSLGNVVAPQEVIERYGAEILRLWVAAEDYRDDIRISEEILKRLAEGYRRIRNTCRYLLGNLSDFQPAQDALPLSELDEIDRFILHRLGRLTERLRRAYEDYEFHLLYHSLHNFCAVDLSAFYLDVLKDRVYTSAPRSRARRAAQTSMYQILDALVRLMAPVLSFTADEVWQVMPKQGAEVESVHLTEFPLVRSDLLDETLEARWDVLLFVRDEVLKALEAARKAKLIGTSLEARVDLLVEPALLPILTQYEADLPMLFIVSAVSVGSLAGTETTGKKVEVRVGRAEGVKCARCWTYSESVGQSGAYPDVCTRCAGVLEETGYRV